MKRQIALTLPLVLIGIAWAIEIVDQLFFAGSLNFPVRPDGPLWGIFTAPFSHADFGHLIRNTVYFIPLSYLVLRNRSTPCFYVGYILKKQHSSCCDSC